METRMKEMAEIRASGDFEKMQEVIERGREASVRVRDVNRKYARQVAGMLPEDLKAKFDDAFKRESFPDVYRESLTQRSVDAALGFADITEDQKNSITTIKSNLERDLKSLNDELAAAIEEGEMTFNIGQGFGNRDRGPSGDLRREKRDLENTSMEALKKVLTPEQIERMPKREEGDRGGDRGNNRGGDRGNARNRDN